MVIDIEDSVIKDFLRGVPLFSCVEDSCVNGFIEEAQVRNYKKGSNIFMRGDSADRLFVVVNGWIKINRETPEGEEVIIAILNKGDVFGERSILAANGDYGASAIAVDNATVIEIPAEIFKAVISKNVNVLETILTLMSRQLLNLRMETEHLAIMSTSQRVGCLLLQLSFGIEGTSGKVFFPYDKSLAAAKLGMKPETFSRALSQLKEYGVTTKGSEAVISDFKKLDTFCCRHCSSLPGECRGYKAKIAKLVETK